MYLNSDFLMFNLSILRIWLGDDMLADQIARKIETQKDTV